jgi:hypothetical protein
LITLFTLGGKPPLIEESWRQTMQFDLANRNLAQKISILVLGITFFVALAIGGVASPGGGRQHRRDAGDAAGCGSGGDAGVV